MNAKRTLVSFLAIATLLFLVATVSAYTVTGDGFTVDKVEVDGVDISSYSPSVDVGETISVKVQFTAWSDSDGIDNDGDSEIDEADEAFDASNVRIKAELEGKEGSDSDTTSYFPVEAGHTYVKTLTLKAPEVDEDELSEDMSLNIEIGNSDFETEVKDNLRVQRPSYDASIMSIDVANSVNAGQRTPVYVVLENIGYNDLENLYVTLSVPELGLERTVYFGDLVAIEDRHNEDTMRVRIYLEVPYAVTSGIYTLEVEVANNDFSNVVQEQITVQNGFPDVAIKSGDNLLVLNPTNHLKVYRVVYPSEELTVVVEAGSSKLVPIKVSEGEYNFDVFVFAGNELAGTVNFSGTSESQELASPVVVLTVILAIIFLVLLVVMIVLITKKPEKTEEFGESYY